MLDSIAGPLQFFLLFRSVRLLLSWFPVERLLLKIVLWSGVGMTVIAALQYVLPPARPTINSLVGIDPFATPGYTAVTRATVLFTNWHLLAGYETVILFIAAALVLSQSDVLSHRALYFIIGMSVVGILLTLTATDIAGAAFGCLLIGIRSGRSSVVLRRFLPLAVVAGLAFSPLIASRIRAETYRQPGSARSTFLPETLAFRAQVWDHQYLPVIKSHLSTGYGPTTPPSITWPFSESLYLTLLLRGGAGLLAAYLALMFVMASVAERRYHERGLGSPLGLALWALIVMLLPMQILFPYFVTAGLPHLFWILAAMASTAPAGASPCRRPARRSGSDRSRHATMSSPALEQPGENVECPAGPLPSVSVVMPTYRRGARLATPVRALSMTRPPRRSSSWSTAARTVRSRSSRSWREQTTASSRCSSSTVENRRHAPQASSARTVRSSS